MQSLYLTTVVGKQKGEELGLPTHPVTSRVSCSYLNTFRARNRLPATSIKPDGLATGPQSHPLLSLHISREVFV